MSKTVLITGASRGIGRAIAIRFAQEGYHLSLCCINSTDALHKLADELRNRYGCTILIYHGDVGDTDFLAAMVEDSLTKLGQIDVLINNAGISYIGLLTDMSIADWNRMVAVNLTAVFAACKYTAPSMVSRKRGRIINISSVWGSVGASCEAAYSACKGGVNSFTKALGKELAPSNIQVNAISCGVIDTDMNRSLSTEDIDALTDEIPAGRMGTPGEVADLAFLLAESPSYLTAQIITLDGGWT